MGFFPRPSPPRDPFPPRPRPPPPPRVAAGIRLDEAIHPDGDEAPPENQRKKNNVST